MAHWPWEVASILERVPDYTKVGLWMCDPIMAPRRNWGIKGQFIYTIIGQGHFDLRIGQRFITVNQSEIHIIANDDPRGLVPIPSTMRIQDVLDRSNQRANDGTYDDHYRQSSIENRNVPDGTSNHRRRTRRLKNR